MDSDTPSIPTEHEAWETERLKTNQRGAWLGSSLSFTLNIVWIVFDWLFEPNWTDFLEWRLLACVAVLPWPIVAYYAKTSATVRSISFASFVSFAACLAFISASYSESQLIGILGYSMTLWGAGLIFSWQLRNALTMQLGLCSMLMLAYFIHPEERTFSSIVSIFFYILSSAVISASASALKHRLLHTSFKTSFQLEIRNRELSDAVHQLTRTQARLVETEKLSALGRLLAGLSHEINNPLNVIVNSIPPVQDYLNAYETVLCAHNNGILSENELEHLKRKVDLEFAREDAPEALEAIQEAAARIRTLHHELTEFVRGKSAERQTGDLNHGLRATANMFSRGLPSDVTLDIDLQELPPVKAHFSQLNQIYLNMLQNAADAIGDSGTIHVRSYTDHSDIVVQIVDTGPGIPHTLRDTLFEPFVTTKDPGKGTGLGLSICHEIVHRHGGTLTLLDTTQGSCFEVRFPLAQLALSNTVLAQDTPESAKEAHTNSVHSIQNLDTLGLHADIK